MDRPRRIRRMRLIPAQCDGLRRGFPNIYNILSDGGELFMDSEVKFDETDARQLSDIFYKKYSKEGKFVELYEFWAFLYSNEAEISDIVYQHMFDEEKKVAGVTNKKEDALKAKNPNEFHQLEETKKREREQEIKERERKYKREMESHITKEFFSKAGRGSYVPLQNGKKEQWVIGFTSKEDIETFYRKYADMVSKYPITMYEKPGLKFNFFVQWRIVYDLREDQRSKEHLAKCTKNFFNWASDVKDGPLPALAEVIQDAFPDFTLPPPLGAEEEIHNSGRPYFDVYLLQIENSNIRGGNKYQIDLRYVFPDLVVTTDTALKVREMFVHKYNECLKHMTKADTDKISEKEKNDNVKFLEDEKNKIMLQFVDVNSTVRKVQVNSWDNMWNKKWYDPDECRKEILMPGAFKDGYKRELPKNFQKIQNDPAAYKDNPLFSGIFFVFNL